MYVDDETDYNSLVTIFFNWESVADPGGEWAMPPRL